MPPQADDVTSGRADVRRILRAADTVLAAADPADCAILLDGIVESLPPRPGNLRQMTNKLPAIFSDSAGWVAIRHSTLA
ncbi:hypothetical protein THAOC_17429, partial [Thalassiosira oceanica]